MIYAMAGKDIEEPLPISKDAIVLVTDFIIRDEQGRPFLYDKSIDWDKNFKYIMESRYTTK